MICAGQVSDRSFEDLQGPLFFFWSRGLMTMICNKIYIPPAATSAMDKHVGDEMTGSCSQVIGYETSRMSALMLAIRWRRMACKNGSDILFPYRPVTSGTTIAFKYSEAK